MPDITIHTIETAPEEVKDVLQTVKDANGGYIPNLIGLLANAPTALETYRTVGEINRRNSLTPTEREVVQITAAVTNGCAFCVAGHTAFSIKQIQMTPQLLEALRNRTPIEDDPKLDTLAKFTIAVINTKGAVTKPTMTSWKLATLLKMPLTLSWVSALLACVTTLTISHKHRLTLNFKNSLNSKSKDKLEEDLSLCHIFQKNSLLGWIPTLTILTKSLDQLRTNFLKKLLKTTSLKSAYLLSLMA